MFDNKSGIFHYRYNLELENIINAICNIAFDIGIQLNEVDIEQINEIEFAKDLFSVGLFSNLTIRKTDLESKDEKGNYIYSKEDFFSEISNYYNKSIFFNEGVTKYLVDSDLLFINKSKSFFYTIGNNPKNRIIASIQHGGILNDVITNIDNIKIKNSLKKINLFEHSAFYNNTIKITEQEIQPILPYIKFGLLDLNKIKKEAEEFDNYWINLKQYKKKYKIDLSDNPNDYFLVLDISSEDVIGLLIEDYLIPFTNVDLVEYITKENLVEYFWSLFELTYSENTKKPSIVNELVTEFKNHNKTIKLNQLLSNLKNNLYINNNINVDVDFQNFFNKVIIIDNLEHLKEYEFLLPVKEKDTAIGIYSSEKKGKNYNLLHWLNHNGDDFVNHFNGNVNSNKKNKLSVTTLKPEVCYYFLEKYFEDLVEDIFNVNKYKFLSNLKLEFRGQAFCEIDFLVNSNGKFYYIEAKTKLSKYYIEEFLKKSSKMIKQFKPILDQGIEIDFILLGGYSDNNVKDFQYFINTATKETKKGYNAFRVNLNTFPYYFNVPIPDITGKVITCISEPEYDKLSQLILEVCPK